MRLGSLSWRRNLFACSIYATFSIVRNPRRRFLRNMSDSPAGKTEEPTSVVGGLRWNVSDSKQNSLTSKSRDTSVEGDRIEAEPVQLSPFTLRSCFGASLCAGAASATLNGQPAVLYAASHAAVLLAVREQQGEQPTREAQLLQGHTNAVVALASDATGRWVATGDAGADNALIVWDTSLCVPVLSLFDWSPEGCRLLALSPDARLLVAVSDGTSPQIALFRWTLGPDKPDATETLSEFGRASHLSLSETLELVVTSASSVAFTVPCADAADGLRAQRPELPRPSGGRCARLVASVFVPLRATERGPRLALTATTRGSIVVWAVVDNAWTLFKEVQAQRDAITVILVSSYGVVVTGNAKGQLRFYDAHLRILYWWQKFTLDSITSISFHTCAAKTDASQDSLDAADHPAPAHNAAMRPAGAFESESSAYLSIVTSSETAENWAIQSEHQSAIKLPESTSNQQGEWRSSLWAARTPRAHPKSNSVDSTGAREPRDTRSMRSSRSSRGSAVDSAGTMSLEEPVAKTKPKLVEEEEEVEEVAPIISDATLQRRPFLLDDLLVCSLNGDIGVVSVNLGLYERLVVGGAAVTAIEAHPEKPQLVTGSCAGELRVYVYTGRGELLVRSELPGSGGAVTALRYAPSGLLLVAGREDGGLTLVEPITLHPFAELRHLVSDPPAVRLLEFAPNSQALAAVDDSMALTLWTHHSATTMMDVPDHEDESFLARSKELAMRGMQSQETRLTEDAPREGDVSGWRYVGKLRAHYRRVVALLFSPDGARILTLSEDRALAECSYGEDGLQLFGLERIEQTAVPCAMIWAPRLNWSESLFLVSNNELKLKTVSDATRMCTSTVLAPDLGSPVRFMQLVGDSRASAKTELLVIGGDRQLGLQLLPTDGNPFKSLSVIGHPDQLTQLTLSCDSQYVFTIGRDDPCVLQWQINPRSVDVSVRMAGPGLAPFFALLPGGPDGWLLQEMQDLFIYAQLLHQGESTPAPRHITDTVPVCELPDLMRAIGFFPSEYEIENLLHEVSLGIIGSDPRTQQTDLVKFDHFVRLFVNHRPAVGLPSDRLRSAFNAFADARSSTVRREALMSALIDLGEGLTRDQVLKYLSVLMRKQGKKFLEDDLEAIFNRVPRELSFAQFRDDILGIIYQLPASVWPAAAADAHTVTTDGGQLPPQ